MLVKCPDCGREISHRAVMCPNCGAPGPNREAIKPEGKCKGPVASFVDTGLCLIMAVFFITLAASLFDS